MLVLKFFFWLFFINFASVVFSIKYESKIELSAIEAVNKDLVRHEGNMNKDVEDEVVTEAAVLIVKANYTIGTALANQLKKRLSETFDGIWSVLISEGHIYASNEDSNDNSKYVLFSYTNKMFLVTQTPKPAVFQTEEQLLQDARGKDIKIVVNENNLAAKIKPEIERLLATEHFTSFDKFIRKLYPTLKKIGSFWSILMCYKQCPRLPVNDVGVEFEVNGIHIHVHQ